MERQQSSLFEAAAKGSVNSLQQLLIDDPLILHRSLVNRVNETPLHVAAMLGHNDFVKEVIEINPQLVYELNLQKRSPLHLAAAGGHDVVVKALLFIDNRLTCLARDRNGMTPVHLAAMKGRDEAVKLLLEAQPDAARMLVYEDEETILHLCVKNYQLEALKLILATVNEAEFVNCKDAHGNTALHLAVEDKQVETTEILVSICAATLDMNAQNEEGLTAMDVLIRSRSNIRDSAIEKSLEHAGVPVLASKTNTNNIASGRADRRARLQQVMKTRSTNELMVVTVLVAGLIFQSGTNPPGGLWQDDNFLMDSKGKYVDPQGRRVLHPVDSHNKTVPYPHQAGKSVLARNNPTAYQLYYLFNTMGFYISLGIITILMIGLPLPNKQYNVILNMIRILACQVVTATYISAVGAVTPKDFSVHISSHTYILLVVYISSLVILTYVTANWSSVKLMIMKWLQAWWRPAEVEVVEEAPETGRIQARSAVHVV